MTIERHEREPRFGELAVLVVGVGLLLGALLDWGAGESVFLDVKSSKVGGESVGTIRTDYGWSGLRYFERLDR